MKRRTICTSVLTGLIAACALLLLGTMTAMAQSIVWNPPCATVTVQNRSGCPAIFDILTIAGGVPGSIPVGVAAWGTFTAPVGGPPMTFTGIRSNGGVVYGLISPGPVMPPPAPAVPSSAWVPNVKAGPACCSDIYFDMGSCTVWILPTTAPPPCRP